MHSKLDVDKERTKEAVLKDFIALGELDGKSLNGGGKFLGHFFNLDKTLDFVLATFLSSFVEDTIRLCGIILPRMTFESKMEVLDDVLKKYYPSLNKRFESLPRILHTTAEWRKNIGYYEMNPEKLHDGESDTILLAVSNCTAMLKEIGNYIGERRRSELNDKLTQMRSKL